jgi:hypothetical protein
MFVVKLDLKFQTQIHNINKNTKNAQIWTASNIRNLSRVPLVKRFLFFQLSSINRNNGDNSKQFTDGTRLWYQVKQRCIIV